RRAGRGPPRAQGCPLPVAHRRALRPHAVRRRLGGSARPGARARLGAAPHGLRGHGRGHPRPARGRGRPPPRPARLARAGEAGGAVSDDAAPTLAPAENPAQQPTEQADAVTEEPSAAPPSDDVAWRRFHPVTPVVRGWKVVAAILAVLAYRVADDIEVVEEIQESVGWGPVVLAILAVAAVGFVYAYLSWRMARFAIGDEAVHLRTGVLFR